MSTAAIPGIVVGIDGSADSEAALRWAVGDAMLRHQQLTLVLVVSPLITGYSGIGMSTPVMPRDLTEWQEVRARRALDEAAQTARSIAGDSKLQMHTEIPFGAVVPTLVELSTRADMMVLGTRGMGAFDRLLLGSVSTALVHHAHCPVALINAQAPSLPAHAPILLGVDGSPGSIPAVELAFQEAAARDVELIALHACGDAEIPEITPVPWWAASTDAEHRLVELLTPYQEQYPEVAVRYCIVRDHPARHLVTQSESAQLVVVGSRGRGGLAGMLLGSVSSAVVHAATTPVIVARRDTVHIESAPTVATPARS
jgi:nucleotide-binding universal stress UspA family protein